MDTVVAVVIAFVVTVALVTLCVTWATVHALRVRNRVVPGVRTPAPLAWLWSPRATARLHRRLRRTVLGTRACLLPDGRGRRPRPVWPALAELAAAVETRAAALDRELVAADRVAMPARARVLAGLRDEVAEVEAINQRLVTMAVNGSSQAGSAPALTAVRERLDALDAALRELSPPG